MRLPPHSISQLLPSPITIIATSTAPPKIQQRADQPAICHGQGCLSVPHAAATSTPPAPPTLRDNTETTTVSVTETIHIWTTIISWRTAYDTVVAATSFNTIATSVSTITQSVTIRERVNVTMPVTVTAPAPTVAKIAPTLEPVQGKKGLQTGDVVSIVLGVIMVVLVAVMWFLIRRFYRMYRAERVLRKQVQTEGTELKQGVRNTNLGGEHVGDVKDKEEWENFNI